MTTTHTPNQKFNRNIYSASRKLTTHELAGSRAWVASAQLKGIADSYDISELTLEFLDNELKLRKAHFFLDGHNWSDFERAISDNTIQIIERLIARKVGA